ncbi:hypothetical protein NLJ89_g3822 [Agrocybe chaxingu]|uniref:Phospholipid/glycerol acyltransferase domain-containing protein n=1 Tax=Agrocybe chaxingu TaxID=84603 RepID=A0A9W8K422_9AGAR|nr:hypothetical protein NLJ89_g3822 [Agrocybe chaxingu]
MEKFSAYRDLGTGIQPFLTPVPPVGSEFLGKLTLPIRYVLGTIRTASILVLTAVYLVVVRGACLALLPIPPLYRFVEYLLTFLLGRSVLFILGFVWISPEQFNRKRGKGPKLAESWDPKTGDIIVSNWASWIEVLWLAIRFNPIFVIPVPESVPEHPERSRSSTPITPTPGRRTGTGSASIQTTNRAAVTRIAIRGFQQASVLKMIWITGHTPSFGNNLSRSPAFSLEEIRKKSAKPIVVFPECTTSNGRGLLRFADVFRQNVPVKGYQVFVMCVRYDPPTAVAPSLTYSVPAKTLGPLSHLFTLAASLSAPQITIRLLAPSESPGSQLFISSEILSDYAGEDALSETCASLIAQMGKLKRTGMGWEEKSNFLEFYRSK